MELILFVGLQGCGKSTFYQRRFAETHVRISLDMLKTRHREGLLFDACLEGKTPMVIDNTNPTLQERARYIEPAKRHAFKIITYYFQSTLEDCKNRNQERPAERVVPLLGMLGTYKRLVLPSLVEGIDLLHYVRIDKDGEFVVEEWSDEV